MAEFCPMHRSITVRCRKVMLDGGNRPILVTRDVVIQRPLRK